MTGHGKEPDVPMTAHVGRGERHMVVIEGPMTIYEAGEHKRELLAALSAGAGLEVDLSGVNEMDTAGVQLLLLAWREALKAGKSARLVAHSAASQEVFDRYQLRSHFDDVPQAPQHG
jgi:anti-sigma B factor antagonist